MKLNTLFHGRVFPLAVSVFALAGMLAVPAFARHQATLVTARGQIQGEVRYLPASRSYEVRRGTATQQVRADEVQQVILAQQPPQLANALRQVQQGSYQLAIPMLKTIVDDYTMMGPDVQAAQALTLAYLRSNRTGEALSVAEQLLRTNPDAARTGSFASVYWEALLAENRMSTLRSSIREAIERGSRELAAVALLRRGDIEMKAEKPREALLDGYLRVVLLFQDVTAVQPEALFKAAEAHEALNEVAHAERWRQRLLRAYATSEFAQRAR